MEKFDDMMYYITHFDYIWMLQWFFEWMSLELFLYALVAYFFVIWIAIVIWVSKDIRNRTNSWLYQIFCIFLVIFGTPLAVFLYLMFRPGKTLLEQEYEEYEDEVQDENIESIASQLHCFSCHKEIHADFKFCPNCCVELKHNCKKCGEEVLSNWKICPYCGTSQEKNQEEDILKDKEDDKKSEDEFINTQDDIIKVEILQEKPPLENELIPTENYFDQSETK